MRTFLLVLGAGLAGCSATFNDHAPASAGQIYVVGSENEQAAAWLTDRGIKVSDWTVRRWGRIGKLKVTNLGHMLKRVPVSELEKLIKENTR